MHPLEAGAFRFKFRRDRRPGLPILPAWRFYPHYFAESLSKLGRWIRLWAGLRWTYGKIKRDRNRFGYSDLALTPVGDDELETHELYAPRERVAS